MRTYRHPLSRLPKPGYLSRRSLRTGAIVLGLVLLVDVVTARYFPQVQSALTLPPLHIASHTSSLQLPSMTNGVTAVVSRGTATTITGRATPLATTTPTVTPALKQLSRDTFARPDQLHWGTASDGQTWGADAMQASAFS